VATDGVLSGLECFLLTALKSREHYGFELVKVVEELTLGKIVPTIGTLYPTLNKLKQKGLVTSRWGDEEIEGTEGARRKYFKITSEGVMALAEAKTVYAATFKLISSEI
jgi:PadR family transcriptional regulator, regulatory protein PadR